MSMFAACSSDTTVDMAALLSRVVSAATSMKSAEDEIDVSGVVCADDGDDDAFTCFGGGRGNAPAADVVATWKWSHESGNRLFFPCFAGTRANTGEETTCGAGTP